MEKYKQNESHWISLTAELVEAIKTESTAIKNRNILDAENRVFNLNLLLDHKDVVGMSSRLTANVALVQEERLTPDDAVIEPVFDGSILQKTQFEGVFNGMKIIPSFDSNEHTLMYTLSFHNEERNYIVMAPVEDARLEVCYDAELDEEDRDVEEAFVRLFEVDDTAYLKTATHLEKTFYSKDIEHAVRVKTVGECAVEILANPVHVGSPDRMQALHTILMHLFDEDDYLIEGFAAQDIFNQDTFRSKLTVDTDLSTTHGSLVEIAYISDFSLEISEAGECIITSTGNLQPALRLDDNDGTARVYPLKYIAHIEDYAGKLDCQKFNDKVRASL